ncbi:MAG: hypothetical protein FIA95_10875, partial [Gemmatimonadetes bacterium]|nr:hypothetical protein [Gemmatimonadota bacterium]
MPPSRAQFICLLLAPMPALCIGALVMSSAGLPAAIWALNGAAAAVGLPAALLAWLWRPPAATRACPRRWALPLGMVILGATLLAPGVDGVHRWLPLGPVQIHAGAVLLPAILVALADMSSATSLAVASITLVFLLLQPDAAQSTSFAAGWIVLVARKREPRAIVGAVVVG